MRQGRWSCSQRTKTVACGKVEKYEAELKGERRGWREGGRGRRGGRNELSWQQGSEAAITVVLFMVISTNREIQRLCLATTLDSCFLF